MKCVRNIWFICVAVFLSLPMTVLNGQVDTICFNDTILYSLPTSGNSVYNWNIPEGLIIDSSKNKDSVTVVWNLGEGLNSIEVTQQSTGFCASEPKVLEVFVFKPTLNLGADIAICEGSTETIAFKHGYKEYLWNNQPGSNEYEVTSEGVLTLEVKDKYGCWSKDAITVIENKNPVPDFMARTDSITREVFITNLSDSLSQFHWNFGDGEYSVEYNPGTHDYSNSGTYTISLTEYANGCSGEITKEVYLPNNLISDFESIYEGCAPSVVTFINRSSGADAYFWNFGNGDTSTDENPITSYDNPGIYEVTLSAIKSNATEVSKRIITIHQSPEAIFDLSKTEAGVSEEIEFYNQSLNAVRHLWYLGDGEISELREPIHSYSSAGIYDISLSVWSESGCFDSLTVQQAIHIANTPCRLIFPSGFIPNKNGSGGGYYSPSQSEDNNEIFHPIYKEIDEYELKIYNRWGILVFESNDINIGWDGYYKGKLAPQDTYLYTVKSRCQSGKEITTTGGITLIH